MAYFIAAAPRPTRSPSQPPPRAPIAAATPLSIPVASATRSGKACQSGATADHRLAAAPVLTGTVIIAGEQPGAVVHSDVVEEARTFMEGYARDIRAGDRAAIAARYDRTGAYRLGNGHKEFQPYDSIVALYQRPGWSPPAAFEWHDLSFEGIGPDAVVIAGRFLWSEPAVTTPVRVSYTALLRRQDGVLRIRLEDESADPRTLPAASANDDANR
jgi:hypothetical protein